MQLEETNSIQVIGRAIAVLKTCDALGPGLSLGDISRQLGLPRSTVQRIITKKTWKGIKLGQVSNFLDGCDMDIMDRERMQALIMLCADSGFAHITEPQRRSLYRDMNWTK